MPFYIDESGSLPAGAMIMAGVDIEAGAADELVARFKAVTGLRGELKGSRIELIERAFFFELLDRFGGNARVCIMTSEDHGIGKRPEDIDVYTALLTQLVDDWLVEAEDCVSVVIDAGRYDEGILENVRQDIAALLSSCGSARMMDSRRSAGIQIADVVANSFFNVEAHSGRAERIQTIMKPFVAAGVIRAHDLRVHPKPRMP
jgi:hypothetical protein